MLDDGGYVEDSAIIECFIGKFVEVERDHCLGFAAVFGEVGCIFVHRENHVTGHITDGCM